MALQRVKAYKSVPQSRETDVSLLAAIGSDGLPYVLQVDETTGEIPVSTGGAVAATTIKETVYIDYAMAPITTADWTEIIVATSDLIKDWSVFDSSGEVMELGVGALGAEARFALVQPGGGDPFKHQLPAGSRISIRAVTANVNDGLLVINAWS
jgi:hypothetical protein